MERTATERRGQHRGHRGTANYGLRVLPPGVLAREVPSPVGPFNLFLSFQNLLAALVYVQVYMPTVPGGFHMALTASQPQCHSCYCFAFWDSNLARSRSSF